MQIIIVANKSVNNLVIFFWVVARFYVIGEKIIFVLVTFDISIYMFSFSKYNDDVTNISDTLVSLL